MNRIINSTNDPFPRSDEMYDMPGEAKFSSNMDLKIGFH